MRHPALARPPADTNATKKPHWMPTVLPSPETFGLSNTRQKMSAAAHSPAAMITVPSPPGSSYSRRSARVNSSASTPAATRKTAASTNERVPKALTASFTKRQLRGSTTLFSYQGRNIDSSSTTAARPASC